MWILYDPEERIEEGRDLFNEICCRTVDPQYQTDTEDLLSYMYSLQQESQLLKDLMVEGVVLFLPSLSLLPVSTASFPHLLLLNLSVTHWYFCLFIFSYFFLFDFFIFGYDYFIIN